MTKKTIDLARIKHLIATRQSRDEQRIHEAEIDFVKDVVGGEVLARDAHVRLFTYAEYGYMTPFGATEHFAKELQSAIETFAKHVGARTPGTDKYNPLFAGPVMLKGTWMTRQTVDELGIPYWFYAQHALKYWADQGNKRVPRPTQLCGPDVLAYVIGLWADPYYRYHYPGPATGRDSRFRADHYIGDRQQIAYLALIDQRVEDAKALGYDPAVALASFLERTISLDEAEARYGAELVLQAMAAREASDAEIAQFGGIASEKRV